METKTKLENNLALAVDISLKYADDLLKRKERDKAIALFKECLRISQKLGRPKLIASCFGFLGGAYLTSRDYLNGIACYERALQVTVENNGDESAVLVMLKALADLYRVVGDYAKADTYMGNHSVLAKKLERELTETESKPRLNYVGQSAEECWNSIAKAEQMLETAKRTQDKKLEADAYNLMGASYRLLREFHKSITYCQKYLEMCDKVGDLDGKTCAYGNLGSSYRHLGEIKKAMEYFEKEKEVTEVTGDKLKEGHAYNNLGICFMDVGDYKKAILHFKYSLNIALAAGMRKEAGGSYSNLSCAHFKLGELTKAVDYSQKHLELAKEKGDRRAQATAYSGLGNAYHAVGDLDAARSAFQQCFDLANKIGDRTLLAVVEINLGLVCKSQKDYKTSLIHYQSSLRRAKETGNKLTVCNALSNKGVCLSKLRDFNGAIASFENCIKEWEDIRANLGNEDSLKVSIADLHTADYKLLASTLLLAGGQVEAAMLTADRGRAMALKDLLYHKFEVKGEYAKIKQQSTEASQVSRFVDKLREDATLTTLFYSVIGRKVFTWVLSGSHLNVAEWPDNEEDYWALITLVETTLAEIRQESLERGSAEHRSMLSSETDSFEDIFDVRGSKSSIQSEHVTSAENLSFQSIRAALRSRVLKPIDVGNPACSLRKLYDILIKPVEHHIQGNKLLIIPETFLYSLPFSALVDNNGVFLSQKYSIQICTSLETLAIISQRPKREPVGGALVIGNPLVGRVYRGGKEICPCELPGAQKEAEKVASYLHTTALTKQQATKSRVVNHLVKASVIHIAAHGDPGRGEIFLAPNPDLTRVNRLPAEEEYLLTCADIADLRLRASLVVLSCCQSAQGDIRAEGVVGIARSFLGAGARSVVVTLWAIDDDATLAFMEFFYSYLYQNLSVCEALQQSMILMQSNKELKSISKWAPFYVIGEDKTFTDEDIKQIREKAFKF